MLKSAPASPRPCLPRGLYAITSDAMVGDAATLRAAVAAALDGGAVLLQFRAKRLAPEARLRMGALARRECADRRVPFIVNDDTALALQLGADGVHLGRDDGAYLDARAALGPAAIIGITCNNDAARAQAAAALGADYIALGRFFPSRTKPDAPPATLPLLRQLRAALSCPICVIGGLTPDNLGPLRDAGADLFAAVDALFGAPDVRAAAQRFSDALR